MGIFSFLTGKPTVDTTVKEMCDSFNTALSRGSTIQDALIHMYKTDAVKSPRLRPITPETFFSEVYEDKFFDVRLGSPEARDFVKSAISHLVETYFHPELSVLNRMQDFDIFKIAEPSEAEILADKYLTQF